MRVAIIADLHGNLEATQAVFEAIDNRSPDRVFCLGDLCGYNAQPNEVIEIVREREIPTIMGNHDAAVCGLEDPWFFRAAAKTAIEWQRERIHDGNREWMARAPEQMVFHRTYLGVHGSPGSRDDYIVDWLDAMRQLQFLNGRDITVCFFGHTHRPSFFSEKGTTQLATSGSAHELRVMSRYFINPGAVGQPRDGDPRAAFGLLDTDKMTFEFCRVEYDVDLCAAKVLAAGLPGELAKRLSKGK
jgi:diadenosine tetraphosphatase ApaH/serine/threonine PP2A family protein phosphatase